MDTIKQFYTDGMGLFEIKPGDTTNFHPRERCWPEPCVVHNPSDHHMSAWPMVWRGDKLCLAERTCPHGIGHPDPDSLAYFMGIGEEWIGTHGCDGCCYD